LYSNYDALNKALYDGRLDLAWNTPLAHAKFTKEAHGSQALVMRDTDVNYRVKLVVRKDAGIRSLDSLSGKTMIFGSCDAAESTVLPAYFLRKEGIDFGALKILSLHNEVDAKGVPCDSHEHVLKALLGRRGRAGIIGLDLWEHLQRTRPHEAAQ